MRAMLRLSFFLLPAVLAIGCSDQHTETDRAHPEYWLGTHGTERGAVGGQDCKACHGADLAGGTVGVACSECHLDAAPVNAHAQGWDQPILQHQTFANHFSWTQCANANCHGAQLKGGAYGPSCFKAFGCHEAGPPAPHAMPYAAPESHGRTAKANLVYCRNCHGTPDFYYDGGFVSDPAILNQGGACTVCHTEAKAHPTFWQGTDDPNSAYRATHQDVIQWGTDVKATCGLCHKTDGPGDGPRPGAPSCFSASFVNGAEVQVPCHAAGP